MVVDDDVQTNYYVIAGMKVAYRNASEMNYLPSDHLGSVVGVVNASYMPFESVREGVGVHGTDLGFIIIPGAQRVGPASVDCPPPG